MKKTLAAILLLIYFTVSTGFVVSLHYCMDRFDSARIGASHDDTCGKCGMDTGENKCCWDEVQVVKLQTSHLFSVLLSPDFTAPAITILHTEYIISPFRNYDPSAYSISHSPPLTAQDVYIENCVFRI